MDILQTQTRCKPTEMIFVYIYDPPLFRQCDVTDDANIVEDFH